MRAISRRLEKQVMAAARSFPAVVLTGPRRSGKTFMLRRLLPSASYHLFEDPDTVARFRNDPQGFLDGVATPVVFDEIQNVPELFNFIRARIDRTPRRTGQWILTGSEESALMRNVTESMAGRAAILHLGPLSHAETTKVEMLKGGYPEVLARPKAAQLWFSSYMQTYLERDVRLSAGVQDLALFRRFLALLASRHGQVLNKSDLAAPLGISVPTVGRWLDVLEATGQVLVVPPYFENLGKRLIKSPKVFIGDSGMACHLLGIQSAAELERSPFLGPIFEGFVASEIAKSQADRGQRRELYFFRDQQGLEVDFLFPLKGGLVAVEAKASRTPVPQMAAGLKSIDIALRKTAASGEIEKNQSLFLVHRAPKTPARSSALAPGVKALALEQFIATILN